MSLESQLEKARKEIVSDGYDMSIGEVMNLYREKELIIDPEFQRYFRWESFQKTRFIESLLLGIPIPPIFVFQTKDGTWELIDGLQRLSTVLEFAGMLNMPEMEFAEPRVLEGTKLLPALSGKKWEPTDIDSADGIGKAQQLQIKRARLRVEILKMESDPHAKYELFQRINTGGSQLSEQEVRNCTAIMINRDFHVWLMDCSANTDFFETIKQTESSSKKQYNVELALRFFAYRNVPYSNLLDVHEYLDAALITLATDGNMDMAKEKDVFQKTFGLLRKVLGENAFKRWDGEKHLGMFLLSVYEVMATGISKNIDAIEKMPDADQRTFVMEKSRELWDLAVFKKNSGAGVRGTTRLSNLLPIAASFFKP
jgi:Protein of unknown function DUF262